MSAPDPSPLARCTGGDDEFLTRVWSTHPVVGRDVSACRFGDLLSLTDADTLLTSGALRFPHLRVVRDGDAVPRASYTVTRSVGRTTIPDLIDAGRAIEAFRGGATLVYQSLHTYWPALGRFCAGLAETLGHATQANAYLSPGEARGLDVHYDTHDVFVLQVEGSKRWQIYAPVFPAPLAFQHWADVRGADDAAAPLPPGREPLLDVTLSAGECLYLPRGFVHRAWTTTDMSLHITIGVHARTWFHAVRDLARAAADDVALRETLPPGADTQPEALRTRLAGWLATRGTDELAEALRLDARRQRAESAGYHAGRLVEAARAVGDRTVVRPRHPAGNVTVACEDGVMVLRSPDHEVRLPERIHGAVERLLAGPATVADLAPMLDEAGRAVLVRRLVADGLLALEREAVAPPS